MTGRMTNPRSHHCTFPMCLTCETHTARETDPEYRAVPPSWVVGDEIYDPRDEGP